MEEIKKDEMEKLSFEEIAKKLETDIKNGISSGEYEKRVKIFGYNEISEEKKNPLLLLLRKFWNPTAWILEVAAILSFFLNEIFNFYIILGLIFVNAIISWIEEGRANRALEILKKKLQVQARVLRDGKWIVVPARELVPGDIIRLRNGDFVPADVKVFEGEGEIDQSAITGESLPVTKSVNGILYSGSIVKKGEFSGIVLFTGTNTYFGKTVELVKVAKPRLRVEEVINRVIRYMLLMTLALIGFAIVVTFIRGENALLLIPLFLVLIIAAIPIALPAMFTVSLAVGAKEMAEKGVLVTRLDSIEGSATMNVLVSDKTGTLTKNTLSVVTAVGNNMDNDTLIMYGALASEEANQDPIDLAFISYIKEKKINIEKYRIEKFVPFDPSTRRTEAIVSTDSEKFTVTKGAYDIIMGICEDKNIKNRFDEEMENFAKKGFRIIAVAVKKETWRFAGIVALRDPPREDSRDLIKALRNLGIKVKMLTGDKLEIAKEIGNELELGENIVSMEGLKNLKNKDAIEASKIIAQADGFAESYPEDKYIIVKSLQSSGHVVGMTGDGVNDAPALKQADVGIAVSNATDVAKGAAAVVLTQPGLKNIVDLVQTGREVFERIYTWILSKTSRLLQDVVYVTIALIITGYLVMNPFGMILLIFMYDFVTISLSLDRERIKNMPATWDINHLVKIGSIIGITMIVESFAMLYFALNFFHLSPDQLPTFGFIYILFTNLFNVLNVRERKNFWKSRPNKFMVILIIIDIVLATIFGIIGLPTLPPIPPYLIIISLLYTAFLYLFVNNFVKIGAQKMLGFTY